MGFQRCVQQRLLCRFFARRMIKNIFRLNGILIMHMHSSWLVCYHEMFWYYRSLMTIEWLIGRVTITYNDNSFFLLCRCLKCSSEQGFIFGWVFWKCIDQIIVVDWMDVGCMETSGLTYFQKMFRHNIRCVVTRLVVLQRIARRQVRVYIVQIWQWLGLQGSLQKWLLRTWTPGTGIK